MINLTNFQQLLWPRLGKNDLLILTKTKRYKDPNKENEV